MRAKLYQIASILLILFATCFYIGAFASTGWLSDDQYDYGFWKRCETNATRSERCYSLGFLNQKGYFEAARTVASFALVSSIFCFITCFLDDNEGDVGMRRTCYRYFFCFLVIFTITLQITVMAVLGSGYQDDPLFTNPELGWCVPFTAVAAFLAFISCLCRCKYIAVEHRIACLRDICCFSCGDDLAKTSPAEDDSELVIRSRYADVGAMDNARNRLPHMLMRRTLSANSDGIDGRITGLPPLPSKPRGALPRTGSLRSTDSGLDSRDVSRDSNLDESTGPFRLSVEMLRRHDRRLNGATGKRDDRRRRPAFSSTTSLSTTDSQSSAELAPRVHTPTSKKRVHYDIPEAPPNEPQPPPPPPPVYLEPTVRRESIAAPIISFPIKMQGVELSRAKTNAKTTATIDNIKLKYATLKKWKNAARTAEEQGEESTPGGAEASQPPSRKKRKKEKKKKREEEEEEDRKKEERKEERKEKEKRKKKKKRKSKE